MRLDKDGEIKLLKEDRDYWKDRTNKLYKDIYTTNLKNIKSENKLDLVFTHFIKYANDKQIINFLTDLSEMENIHENK